MVSPQVIKILSGSVWCKLDSEIWKAKSFASRDAFPGLFCAPTPAPWPDQKPFGLQPCCLAGCQPSSGKNVRRRQNISRPVSRVTCVASRKLKRSVMMIRYWQQMVAVRRTCVSGEGRKASRADTTVGSVWSPLQELSSQLLLLATGYGTLEVTPSSRWAFKITCLRSSWFCFSALLYS